VVNLVRSATTYRSLSPDLRPLLVFPLASRVEMSEDDLRRDWRYGGDKQSGYQPRFEELFQEVYDLPECHLEHYFDEIQIQHATRYAYGERIAVRDEDSDRLSLSRSYERFTRALHDSSGPWTFEKEPKPRAETGKGEAEVLERLRRASDYHARHARRAKVRDLAGIGFEAIVLMVTLVSTITAWLRYPSNHVVELTAAVLPIVLIGLAVIGITEYFRRQLGMRPRYVIHARAASALKRELALFASGAGPYASSEGGDPTPLLTERSEQIISSADESLLHQWGRLDGPPGRSSHAEEKIPVDWRG
jgi:hypothetical protein